MARRRTAKKAWRFIRKHRRRRSRMHPVRRRQETASFVLFLVGLPLAAFFFPPAGIFVGTVSGGLWVSSKATPPKTTQRRGRKPKNLLSGGEQFSGRFTSGEALRTKKRAMTCSDACKRSTHPKNTCDCICNGAEHGVEAGMYGGPGPATTKPRRRRPAKKTRRQVRG